MVVPAARGLRWREGGFMGGVMGGVTTYAELRETRSPAGVLHAVQQGRLVRLRRGVYGDPPPDLLDRLAAVQAAVPRAVASHRSAAALHGIGEAARQVEVTVPQPLGLPSTDGLRVYRARRPPAVRTVRDLVTTSIARTVVDVARAARWPLGVEVADAALALGHCDRDDLRRELGHHRGLRGVARARQAYALCRVGAQSPAETRLRLLLLAAGLPEPALQHPVDTGLGRWHVDLAWPDRRVAVEYDGRAWHGDAEAFDRDRRRWRSLHAAGWRVLPVSASDTRDPHRLAAEVRAALSA